MFEKLRTNKPLRVVGVIVSFIFILGAALNDGWSEWFLGIPFILLLYKIVPLSKKHVVAVCVVVVALSAIKSMASLVYPMIGTEVVIIKDTPFIAFEGQIPVFDDFPEAQYQSRIHRFTVPAGSVYKVVKVIGIHPDFNLKHQFILKNEKGRIAFDSEQLQSARYPLCYYIQGEICQSGVDPMNKIFRAFASLMYYPIFPSLISNWLS